MRAGAHDFVLKDRLARLVPAVQRELREAADRRQRRAARGRAARQRGTVPAARRARAGHHLPVPPAAPTLPWNTSAPPSAPSSGTPRTSCTPTRRCCSPWSSRRTGQRSRRPGGPRNPDPLTVRWRRRDGGLACIEQRAVAVTTTDGNVVAVEGILRDITERVLAEQERAAPGTPAAPDRAAGLARPARRRRRPRLQQPARGHHRLLRHASPTRSPRTTRCRADVEGIQQGRRTRRLPHPATAHLQPSGTVPAGDDRPQRGRRRDPGAAQPHARRGHRVRHPARRRACARSPSTAARWNRS